MGGSGQDSPTVLVVVEACGIRASRWIGCVRIVVTAPDRQAGDLDYQCRDGQSCHHNPPSRTLRRISLQVSESRVKSGLFVRLRRR